MRKEYLEYMQANDKLYVNIDDVQNTLLKLIKDMKKDEKAESSVWVIENLYDGFSKFKRKFTDV